MDKKQYKEHILSQISKKSALIMAIEKENINIIQLLLNYPNIELNINSEVTITEEFLKSKLGKDGGGWIVEKSIKKDIIESPLDIAKRIANREIIQKLTSIEK